MFNGASAASASALSAGAELLLQPASISMAALNGASQRVFLLIERVIEIVIGLFLNIFASRLSLMTYGLLFVYKAGQYSFADTPDSLLTKIHLLKTRQFTVATDFAQGFVKVFFE